MTATKAPFVFEPSFQNYFDLILRACLLKFVTAYFTRMRILVQHFSVDEKPFTFSAVTKHGTTRNCLSLYIYIYIFPPGATIPIWVVFYSPLVGFSLLAYEVS